MYATYTHVVQKNNVRVCVISVCSCVCVKEGERKKIQMIKLMGQNINNRLFWTMNVLFTILASFSKFKMINF